MQEALLRFGRTHGFDYTGQGGDAVKVSPAFGRVRHQVALFRGQRDQVGPLDGRVIGKIQPIRGGDDGADLVFQHGKFRQQHFQGFHHVAQIGFGRVVQQGGQAQMGRHQFGDDQAVLGDRVKHLRLSIEAALVSEAVGDVLDGDLVDMRAQGIKTVAGIGGNVVGGNHCHGMVLGTLKRLHRTPDGMGLPRLPCASPRYASWQIL
ncbi:hypothetical protein D3C81_1540680 [compost metagenome]